jgi:predicted ATP-grasp superfamily ATP-dependent carboligase
LLCCNEQQVSFENAQFQLHECRVNIQHRSLDKFQKLVEKIAQAIPGLWGYIGIDIIDSDVLGPVILEINPRLTTSYVGIHSATGINVAEQVIKLIDSEPVITRKNNKLVNVTIKNGQI